MHGLVAALKDDIYDGEAQYVPTWAKILMAAEAWGMPPWEVERQCNGWWWKRWLAWLEAKGMAQSDEGDPFEALAQEWRER